MKETPITSLRHQTNARLACHAWEISGQLRKVANRFPQSREKILGYSEQLEAIGTSLLSILLVLKLLPIGDLPIAQHHIETCHSFLNTFQGLQELLNICSSNSKLQPVILFSGERLCIQSHDAHLHFQRALSSMKASICRALYSMRESFKIIKEVSSDFV
jgi:hypothetical protein